MCGIAGIFHYAEPDKRVDRELLERMTRAIAHRGPDAEAFFVDGPLGFGHRRLSIVDLSSTGAQPMRDESGRFCITYNGEFYNHSMFRPALEARGVRFRGSSDTETLLYLVGLEGPEALARTAGIFGFGLWDARERSLTLARDPLGVKQVYFHDDGRRIIFASEIKALLVDPSVPRSVDHVAMNDYLHFHTPLFDRTFFEGIRQLRQGEFLRISPGRPPVRKQYWTVSDFEKHGGSDADKSAELAELLDKVVREQLMSDVPVGSFLSGGIDSTAIAEFARRAGKKPQCFGVHFDQRGVIDERPYQELAARALGVDLQLITVDERSLAEELPRLIYYQDQPVIGPALLPMFHVSRLAASQVKVCLGGQGADEIFGGYARYALTKPMHVLRGWMRRGDASGGGPSAIGGNLRKQLVSWRNVQRLASAARQFASWEKRYFEHFATVPQDVWKRVFADPALVSRANSYDTFRQTVAASAATDPADKAMHWDVQTYLPGLFQQDDRMSMANSLESRVPMSDPRLVEFAFKTGFDTKFRSGSSKWLLRRALEGVVPEEVLNRRKVGFDTPMERWLRESRNDFLRDTLLSKRALERGLWNPRELRALVEKPNTTRWFDAVWKVLSIELWATVFLDRNDDNAALRVAPPRSVNLETTAVAAG